MRSFNILERDLGTNDGVCPAKTGFHFFWSRSKADASTASPGFQFVLGLITDTEAQMFKSILVPIDLADTDLAKPAIATAATLSKTWSGAVRLLNVLPMTPVMLAEYVPADFDTQQRQTSEEALAIVARESGIDAPRISGVVRQGGIYHEILEEAAAIKADLIVMTSHRPAMRTYFLGSNAGHVVRYAKCSVLVVRH
jgi:nucleotide-binding universal stress UspA family protein